MKQLRFNFISNVRHTAMDGEVDFGSLLDLFKAESVAKLVDAYRSTGDAKHKSELPALFFQGISMLPLCEKGGRLAKNMVSNCKYVIDLDKMEDAEMPCKVWNQIKAFSDFSDWKVQLAYISPSGKGLKLVCEMRDEHTTIKEAQEAFVSHFCVEKYFDAVNIDLSRLAFVSKFTDILHIEESLCTLVFKNEAKFASNIENWSKSVEETPTANNGERVEKADMAQTIDSSFEDDNYRGRSLKQIIEEWTMHKGARLGMIINGVPNRGEVNALHYQILTDIKNLCDANPARMTALVPHFGHKTEEIFNQAKKVCSYANNGKLPSDLYFWLKQKGYDKPPMSEDEEEELLQAAPNPYQELLDRMPEMPPLIKEIVGTAPNDFKIPTLMAMMPVIGTLTTYCSADYIDGEAHTTSFITTLYAPPSSGKSTPKRYIDPLFFYIRNRDELVKARENLFNALNNAKGGNKDKEIEPEFSKREFPSKWSEAEMMKWNQANHGAHIFTFAPEIDTFSRNIRGLSDILRIAWDNDKLGQAYVKKDTYKGDVHIHWNILLTGTPERVLKFYNNLEDGLITRVSIAEICNQEFQAFQPWKKLSKAQLKKIDDVIKRFDDSTYLDPLDYISTDELAEAKDDTEFDKKWNWRFQIRPRVKRDLSFVYPEVNKFLKKSLLESIKGNDHAKDVFRRRAANKGFRSALVANELWGNPSDAKTRQKVKKWCAWWCELELFSSLRLWGKPYNESYDRAQQRMNEQTTDMKYATIYDLMPQQFTKSQLSSTCQANAIASAPKYIVFTWKQAGLIEKVSKNTWKKLK